MTRVFKKHRVILFRRKKVFPAPEMSSLNIYLRILAYAEQGSKQHHTLRSSTERHDAIAGAAQGRKSPQQSRRKPGRSWTSAWQPATHAPLAASSPARCAAATSHERRRVHRLSCMTVYARSHLRPVRPVLRRCSRKASGSLFTMESSRSSSTLTSAWNDSKPFWQKLTASSRSLVNTTSRCAMMAVALALPLAVALRLALALHVALALKVALALQVALIVSKKHPTGCPGLTPNRPAMPSVLQRWAATTACAAPLQRG